MSESEPQGDAPKRERFFDPFMWVILVLGICGIAVYQMYKYQAFPAASIEIKVPRLEIQEQAKALAPQYGFAKKNLIESTVFDNDDDSKTFLEHEYPQDKANQLMATELPIWYWKTELCKEFDQEDFTAWTSPQGKLISFDRDIPNDVALKSLSHDEARKVARAMLEKLEPDAAKYKVLVKDEAFTRTKREDHSFTWENQETDYKSAHLRIDVDVSGDQITQFDKYLHVPDKWERDFATMRSYNYLFGQFAFFFIYLFQTIGFLVFVWAIITKNIRWRPVIFGATALGGISALDYLNHLPSLIAGYSPTTSFQDYIIKLVFTSLIGLLGNAVMGAFLFGGAEVVYRKFFPHKISFECIMSKAGLTHEKVVQGVVVGYLLVGVHLGWIVLYYIFGKQFHYWCPLGVESHEVLSNVVPFVSAVALGVSASFEEELACRVIGLGLGMKLFKNFWIANIFQAVVWGFAHSNYPQEPAYARGVEIAVIGLMQGWILKRYGIVACITEHYLIDSFMYVEAFLYSDVPALKLSVIPALIPGLVLIALAFILKPQKKMEVGDALDNDKIPLVQPPPPAEEEPHPPITYTPLSKKVRANLTIICVLAIVCAVFLPWQNGINADAKLSVSRAQAVERAKAVMRKHNIDPEDWMQTSYCSTDGVGDSFQYMFEKTDADIVKKIYDDTKRGFYWSVRFFKPLKSEQYEIYLDGQGNEVSFGITREEDDAGAKLSSDEARALAEKYLTETHPEFKGFEFKHISPKKHKNRLDYTVEFNYPPLNVAEADCRIEVEVIGDQVGNFQQHWDVPDSWQFERDKRTWKDEWLGHLRTAMFVALIGCFLVWCYSVLKTGAIRYRAPLAITLGFVVLILISRINNGPTFFSGYDTTTPLDHFITSSIVATASGLFSEGAGIFLLSAVALGALRIICPRTPILPFIQYSTTRSKTQTAEDKEGQFNLWFDAVLFSYSTMAFFSIVTQLHGMLSRLISPAVPTDSIASSATGLCEVYVPVLYIGLQYLRSLPTALSGIIVVAGMAARFAPGFWRLFGIGFAMILILKSGERYWQDYVLEVSQLTLLCLYLYVGAVQIAKSNYIAYALVFFLMCLIPYVVSILLCAPTLFVPEVFTLTTLLMLPLLLAIGFFLRRGKRQNV